MNVAENTNWIKLDFESQKAGLEVPGLWRDPDAVDMPPEEVWR